MSYPTEYRYTKDHEWVELKEGRGRLGITDHAQAELGDIVFVELPTVGTSVRKGEVIATVESVKAVGDVSSPATGKIAEVNPALESAPETVNKTPHGDGWLVVLDLDDPAELDETMDAAAYESFLAQG